MSAVHGGTWHFREGFKTTSALNPEKNLSSQNILNAKLMHLFSKADKRQQSTGPSQGSLLHLLFSPNKAQVCVSQLQGECLASRVYVKPRQLLLPFLPPALCCYAQRIADLKEKAWERMNTTGHP